MAIWLREFKENVKLSRDTVSMAGSGFMAFGSFIVLQKNNLNPMLRVNVLLVSIVGFIWLWASIFAMLRKKRNQINERRRS